MPPSVAQQITDLLVEHDISLLRVLDGTERLIEREVNDITLNLVSALARSDPSFPARRSFGQRRLDRLIREGRGEIAQQYRRLYREVRRELIELAEEELVAYKEIVNQGLGAALMREGLRGVSLIGIIDERVFTANANDADTLRGFFEREAAAHHKRFSGALRQGFAQGENLSQLTARLRQLTDVHQREATVVARTAQNHVVTNVRIEMMQRNAHIFRGVVANVMLDGRTTKICISRSNAQWDLNTGRPLPSSPVQIRFPGPTPWHMGERTQLYPLTKTARQIGRSSQRARRAIQSLTPEQRSLLNADPPAIESYPDWLRRQPESVQVKVLGRARRELWLEGKLSLRDLVTQRGRTLTLKQLAQRRNRAA